MKVLIDAGHFSSKWDTENRSPDVGSFIFATCEERGAYV